MSISLARTVYDRTIREKLPRKLGLLNGVTVRKPRLFDTTDCRPEYKSALLQPIRDHTTSGETVVNIGGGYGVSTVISARQVRTSGRVVCYEGAQKFVGHCRNAVELNDVSEQVEIRHAVVGKDVDVWGLAGNKVAPSDLPECDCLVMDCEGAEWSILRGLDQRPRVLVVEVHPPEVDVEDVRGLFSDWGYSITVGKNPGGPPVVSGVRLSDST